MKRIILIILFSFFISLPAILPFFHSGYFPTHDGEWAVVRLADMFRTLRDFQIPARYSGNLNFGYGYPLFNFAYPFPYYLGVMLKLLGFGFVDSIKILFAASVPLSAFFMFLASRILWRSTLAGLVSAIMYVYVPYRMVDLYVRGSIGESLSFALFPLLFYLVIKLIEKPSYIWGSLTAISIAILIATHNIMTILFLPVFIAFIISQIIFNKKKVIKPIILSIVLGIGISAFFWLPALFEKQYILLSKIPIADRSLYFVKLDQFLFPKWGYGVPTDANGFSYQLGLSHLIVLVFTIFVFLFTIRHSGGPRQLTGRLQNLYSSFLVISIIIYIFLLFRPSAFLWKHVPLLSEINYPWTALGILGFLISLLAGFLSKQVLGRFVMIFLGIIAVVLVLPYAKTQYYFDKGDDYYITNDATTTSSNELMPKWVKEKPIERFKEKVEIVEGAGKVDNVSYNSKRITFDALAQKNTEVRVNTIYYPGWNAVVNNQKSEIDYSHEKGVMEVKVPKGKSKVELKFLETHLRLFADILSAASILLLLFYVSISRRLKFR